MKNILPIAIFLLIVAGCGPSTHITSSWKTDITQPGRYNKIVVLGLINDPDHTLREKMEEHIVGDLKDLGYNAVCSCNEFSPETFKDLNEKQALDKLTGSGIDAVLTVVLLDKAKERYYVPERINYSPYVIYHNHFWGYYRTMYDRVYAPDYFTVDTKYFWETNFYSLETKQLLYSAQSRSFNPESAQTLGHEYGQIIIKDMVKSKVLINNQPTPKPM